MSQGEAFIVLNDDEQRREPTQHHAQHAAGPTGINKLIAETDPHFLVITYTPSQSAPRVSARSRQRSR